MSDAHELWFDPKAGRYYRGTADDGALAVRNLAGEERSVDPAALTPVEPAAAESALGEALHTLELESEALFVALFPDQAQIEGFDPSELPEDLDAMTSAVSAWLLDPERVRGVLRELAGVTHRLSQALRMLSLGDDEAAQERAAALDRLAGTLRKLGKDVGRKALFGKKRQVKALVEQLEAAIPTLAAERELQRIDREFEAHLAGGLDDLLAADPDRYFE